MKPTEKIIDMDDDVATGITIRTIDKIHKDGKPHGLMTWVSRMAFSGIPGWQRASEHLGEERYNKLVAEHIKYKYSHLYDVDSEFNISVKGVFAL